jgi:transposase
LRDLIARSRWSCVSDAVITPDPIAAARIAALEAMVAEQRAALDAKHAAWEAERAARESEQAAHVATKAERDRLREAYDALTREVELARRRLVVAKAERVDTAQLELEFAATLAKLDALSRKAEDEIGEKPSGRADGERTRKKQTPRGRRDLRLLDLPEEHIAIPDPLLEGKAARIGTAEESVGLRWKRGGFVRVVIERVKYDASKPAMTVPASPTAPSDAVSSATPLTTQEPATRAPACTPEDLAAIVASDPRTAGAVIVTAPMPPRLIDRSYATPSLIAHIASDKFCDGLPLHRQEDRFARLGVPIDRGTMCRWLEEAGGIVGASIVDAMRKEALGSARCIATDATGIRVQPEPRQDKKSQPCRRAHYFVQIADADHVFFEFTPAETSEVVDRMFAGYTGFVQADAKSVFDVLFRVVEDRDRPLVEQEPGRKTACTEVGCWSHARTKFWETAVATQDVVAREALARIMRMFHLDAMWKNRLPDVRKDLRTRYLHEHVTSFFAFVEQAFVDTQHRRGMLRSALGYCRNQKAALMRFLDDGALEMTNNRSERQLRRVATGRQAWLFVGSDLHGTTSGYLLTLIASARLHRLDPEVYLRDVFRVLPHWPRERHLELAPRYWRITRARLRPDELDQEVGWLTIPEQPLPTTPAANPTASAIAIAAP